MPTKLLRPIIQEWADKQTQTPREVRGNGIRGNFLPTHERWIDLNPIARLTILMGGAVNDTIYRTLNRVMKGHTSWVRLDFVDRVLCAIDRVDLWHTTELRDWYQEDAPKKQVVSR